MPAGLVVCIDELELPVAPVIFDPFVIFLALVILLCAFAMWTVYKAIDVNVANSTAAVIMNASCFCIKTLATKYYI